LVTETFFREGDIAYYRYQLQWVFDRKDSFHPYKSCKASFEMYRVSHIHY
jgi:hypothetical protein